MFHECQLTAVTEKFIIKHINYIICIVYNIFTYNIVNFQFTGSQIVTSAQLLRNYYVIMIILEVLNVNKSVTLSIYLAIYILTNLSINIYLSLSHSYYLHVSLYLSLAISTSITLSY